MTEEPSPVSLNWTHVLLLFWTNPNLSLPLSPIIPSSLNIARPHRAVGLLTARRLILFAPRLDDLLGLLAFGCGPGGSLLGGGLLGGCGALGGGGLGCFGWSADFLLFGRALQRLVLENGPHSCALVATTSWKGQFASVLAL